LSVLPFIPVSPLDLISLTFLQWISMSHWHTEKGAQSKTSEGVGAVVKRKQSEDDSGVQNDDISPLKKSIFD
jgi:hypothetical protein